MSTPDDTSFEAAFADLAHSAELMVDPVDSAVIHGRVRRRRTTRGALAAALAALIVAVPAAWWLQESNGEEVAPPAEETTASPTPETTTPTASEDAPEGGAEGQETDDVAAPVLPTFDDLVGAQMDLPPFMDDPERQMCPTDPATIADGTPDWHALQTKRDTTTNEAVLLKVVHTPLREGGPAEAVALFECWQGDPPTRQAVVIAADGDGGWTAGEQLLISGGEVGSLVDIAPAADYGLVMAMAPMASAPDDPTPWFLLARPGEDDPLREVSDPGPGAAVTDLEVELELVEGADGAWTAEASVVNSGDQTSAPYQLVASGSESMQLEGVELADFDERALEVRDGLEPGERYEVTWTLEVPPTAEWTEDERIAGLDLRVWVKPLQYSEDGLIVETDNADNGATVNLPAADAPTG